jgi:predicted small lipoprotein YifL
MAGDYEMKISVLVLSIVITMSLSACGKRGPLEPPPARLANPASFAPVSAPLVVIDHASL